MAITVSINGSSFPIPTQGETKWATAVTALLQALSTGLLQKAGGSFPLTAEVDFGSNFGTAQLYIKSKASNPGTAGFLRLATGDVIAWRNYDNSADVNFGYLRNTTFNYDAPEFGSKELINVDSNQFLRNKIFGDADTTPIDDNAVFEVRSTVKGVIPFPKMNETQRDAIATPPNGLWIYNTTKDLPEFFNGTAWVTPGVLSNTPVWNETEVAPSAASVNTRFMRKDGGTETVLGDKTFSGTSIFSGTGNAFSNPLAVADGIASGDAVNKGQLNAVNTAITSGRYYNSSGLGSHTLPSSGTWAVFVRVQHQYFSSIGYLNLDGATIWRAAGTSYTESVAMGVIVGGSFSLAGSDIDVLDVVAIKLS